MSKDHYKLTPVPARKPNPHSLVTAALLQCHLCGETIDGMGGPGNAGQICKECGDDLIAGRLRGAVIRGEE